MAKNEANRRIEAGVVFLVLLGLVACAGAGELVALPPKGQAGATKTLSFPVDRWIGDLYVDIDSGPARDTRGVRLFGEWEYLGAARGEVGVPADRHVWLQIILGLNPPETARLLRDNPRSYQFCVAERTCEPPLDLSGLSQLDPNDLFRLYIGSPMYRRTGVAPAFFDPISRLTGLQILYLGGSGITDAGMECLRPLRSLKAMELRQSGIGSRGLAVLKDLPSLEHLDLCTAVTDAGLKEVAEVSTLRSLHITDGAMWGPGLAELAKLPRLEQLCIQSTLSDRHIQHLEGLMNLRVLAFWYVGGALTDASLASIAKLESLEELHFVMSSPKFTPAGVARLKGLKNLKVLDFGEFTWLNPSGGRCGDELAKVLTTFPRLESIRGLSYLTAEGMKTLSTMRNLKSVHLTLKDHKLGYNGPTGVSCLPQLSSLEELWIEGSPALSDADFAGLESLSRLKELLITGPGLDERGLASLGKMKNLERLTARVTTVRGLNCLNGLPNLEQLQISPGDAPIEAASSREISLDLSGLRKMKDLNLDGLLLCDDDLAFLKHLPSVERLRISLTDPLTGEALQHLSGLAELNTLIIGNLSNCTGCDMAHLNGLTKLTDLSVMGKIGDVALASPMGPPRLKSLLVETDVPIRKETVADLAARLPSLEYIRIMEPFLPATQPADAPTNGRTDPLRANRQIPRTTRPTRR